MALSANEALLDAMVRHQTYLLRYSSFVRNRIAALLDRSERSLAQAIRDRLEGSNGLNTPKDIERLEALLAVLGGIRGEAWLEASKWLEEQMVELAYQEPINLQAMFTTVSPVVVETVAPTARLLRSIALSRPFEGRVMREWAEAMQAEDLRRIHAAVQLGMVAGEGSAAIARRVVGTGELKGTDGVTEMTRRQVQAITRTAVQHVANNARAAFMEENADIVAEEIFVATLDSRTTMVCKANDGKKFPRGKGPRPPLHWQCRSLRVAALDGDMLGNRPAKASTTQQLLREFGAEHKLGRMDSRKDIPHGMKTKFDVFARKRIRQLTGQVPSATSYQVWLQRQSRQFQEDTLGIAKAKLFREGGLKLEKFVAADGTELTLGQLAAKHASAFRAAGLDPQAYR